MQTTFGNHQHRSSRNNAAGTKHDGIGMIHLPEGVQPLPQLFPGHGYHTFNEGGIHMPLIVAGPGIARGKVRDDLVSGIDIAPASLAATGFAIPVHMEGRNFLAADHAPREFIVAARDRCDYTIEHIRAIVTPRFKYLRNYLTDRPYMQPSYKDSWPVSIRMREMMARGEMNETQKIFFSDVRPAEELYDLTNDPHEIYNLAADPKHSAGLEHHRQLLAQWIKQTGDKGQTPEDDAGLIQTLYEWGDKCVTPEYDRLRPLIDLRETKGKKAKSAD